MPDVLDALRESGGSTEPDRVFRADLMGRVRDALAAPDVLGEESALLRNSVRATGHGRRRTSIMAAVAALVAAAIAGIVWYGARRQRRTSHPVGRHVAQRPCVRTAEWRAVGRVAGRRRTGARPPSVRGDRERRRGSHRRQRHRRSCPDRRRRVARRRVRRNAGRRTQSRAATMLEARSDDRPATTGSTATVVGRGTRFDGNRYDRDRPTSTRSPARSCSGTPGAPPP